MNKSTIIATVLALCVLLGCKNTSKQRTDKTDSVISESQRENRKEENNDKTLKLTVMKLTDKEWQEIKESYYKIEKSREDFFDKDESGEEEFDLMGIITPKDIELGGMIYYYGLKQRGYHFLSDSAYIERIKYVYGIDLNSKNLNSNKVRAYNNYVAVLIPTKSYDDPNDMLLNEFYPDRPYPYFLKKFRLSIVEMPLVTIIQMDKTTDKDNVVIYNNPFFYHWNNYVLNDNKGSLVWLKNNGYNEDLQRLLYFFGYDKEEKINKSVLDRLEEYTTYQRTFAGWNIEENLQIREGLLKTVSECTTKEFDKYYKVLGAYTRALGNLSDRSQEEFRDKFTPRERRKVLAYTANTLQSLYEQFFMDSPNTVADVLVEVCAADDKLLPEWEQNNCYGLPHLPRIIEHLRKIKK